MPVISARKLAQTEDGQTNSQLTALKTPFILKKLCFPRQAVFMFQSNRWASCTCCLWYRRQIQFNVVHSFLMISHCSTFVKCFFVIFFRFVPQHRQSMPCPDRKTDSQRPSRCRLRVIRSLHRAQPAPPVPSTDG